MTQSSDSDSPTTHCPRCGEGVLGDHDACVECGFSFSSDLGQPPNLADYRADDEPTEGSGEVLEGRYQVQRRLARGGMGEVFLGIDLKLKRRVAIKYLSEEHRSNRLIVSRFLQEAQASASLDHPNVIAVYSVGESRGTPFIVMKYVEGETLAARIRSKGRLGLAEAIGIAMQVCDGLEAVHAKGFVHRDIKPRNLMIDRGGNCVILDFGIMRFEGSELTLTGIAVGTPSYLPPEQAWDARSADARSDLYALGVVLFEMLTGRRPFRGESAMDVIHQHRLTPPPLASSLVPALPPEVDALLGKLLAKAPDDRYQSAAELRQALKGLSGLGEGDDSSELPTLGERPSAKSRGKSRRRSRRGVVTAALVVLAGLAAAVGWSIRRSSPPSAIAVNDRYLVARGRSLTVPAVRGVLANDVKGASALRAELATPPRRGDLSLRPDGAFVYRPPAGFAGRDGFTYRVRGAGEALGRVVLTVSKPPRAAPDTYGLLGKSLTVPAFIGLLSNDDDPEGSPLTAHLIERPRHGRVDLDSSGAFRYVPHSTEVRTDTFTYAARDGTDRSEETTVLILGVEAQDSIPLVGVDVSVEAGRSTSSGVAVSADGGHTAFASDAPDLVDPDRNRVADVFLSTTLTGNVQRVSISSEGHEANGPSGSAAIAADGRSVVFVSSATNLVAGDHNGQADVFVREVKKGRTRRISVASDGKEVDGSSAEPSISADGAVVVFVSSATNLVKGDRNALADIFVRDEKAGKTTRVSLALDSGDPDGASRSPSISADGRVVVFESDATNLVVGDRNRLTDVFAHDLRHRRTWRVSVGFNGQEGNGPSVQPSVSADGRWVVFRSYASNLTAGDDNAKDDVFLHDLSTGETLRLSDARDGGGSRGPKPSLHGKPAISANGAFVVFASSARNLVPRDSNEMRDIFAYNRETRLLWRVNLLASGKEANGHSWRPALSLNANYVAFESSARNLTAAYQKEHRRIMLMALQTETPISRVSLSDRGEESNGASGSPAISGDGRFVAFVCRATNLSGRATAAGAQVYVSDRHRGRLGQVGLGLGGQAPDAPAGEPAISATGRFVAFSSAASNLVAPDRNGAVDIFLHDRTTGHTSRVSVASDGAEANGSSGAPAIAGRGRYVAFRSDATNLVSGDGNGVADIFLHDRETATTSRVSLGLGGEQANGPSGAPALSADGRFLVFASHAQNLVARDRNDRGDIFLRDLRVGRTVRVSEGPGGADANGESHSPVVSADGFWIAFVSKASNLVSGDGNGVADVFLYERTTRRILRVSGPPGGSEANGPSDQPAISGDARFILFRSSASNLVEEDKNNLPDIFEYDRRYSRIAIFNASGAAVANDISSSPAVSADGCCGVFVSTASNLVPGDANGVADVFAQLTSP